MLRRSRLVLAATALSVTTFALAAHAALTMTAKSEVKIEASANMIGGFDGTLKAFDGYEKDGKLVFKTSLLKVDLKNRDEHFHEAFGTEKYPSKKRDEAFQKLSPDDQKKHKEQVAKYRAVKLSIDKSKLKPVPDGGKSKGSVSAMFTLHDVTKSVTVSYEAERSGSKYVITNATFTFPYVAHGVEKICKAVVCVKPDVTITVPSITLKDE